MKPVTRTRHNRFGTGAVRTGKAVGIVTILALVGMALIQHAPIIFSLAGAAQMRAPGLEAKMTQRPATGLYSDLGAHDAQRWHRADGWANGAPFANRWCARQVQFHGGFMHLELSSAGKPGCQQATEPYVSGEYRSNQPVGFGRVEARFRAARGAGVVSSLFTYTGPSDGNGHHEVDIEILGADPTRVHMNYFVDGQGQHEHSVALGFDASEEFHTYAFEWRYDSILWFVDDALVHVVNTGPLPSTAGRIMMNLWPVDASAQDWAGQFNYPGQPLQASYDWVRFTPLEELPWSSSRMALLAARAPALGQMLQKLFRV